MSEPKKILATRRRREFFVLRRRLAFSLFCDACGTTSEFVSLPDATALTTLKMRDIVRRTETGECHFLETESGHLFICRNSLDGDTQSKGV